MVLKTPGHRRASAALFAAALFLTAVLSNPVAAMESGCYAIVWSVWGGGGPVSSPSYSLDATIGHASIGLKWSADYAVCSGFWCELGQRVYLPLAVRRWP